MLKPVYGYLTPMCEILTSRLQFRVKISHLVSIFPEQCFMFCAFGLLVHVIVVFVTKLSTEKSEITNEGST